MTGHGQAPKRRKPDNHSFSRDVKIVRWSMDVFGKKLPEKELTLINKIGKLLMWLRFKV